MENIEGPLSDNASVGQSPKVSTVGTFEDSQRAESTHRSGEASLQGRSLHDHHHWSDLPPRMPGEKSVASSLAAENASVVDAVEVEEVTEEQQADEEAPTEIVLTQVHELSNGGLPTAPERSIADSSPSRPLSKQGSLAAAEAAPGVASLVEHITHGEVSPSQAAEALGALALNGSSVSAIGGSTSGGSGSGGSGSGHKASAGSEAPSVGHYQREEEAGGGEVGDQEWGESIDLEDVVLSEEGSQQAARKPQHTQQQQDGGQVDDVDYEGNPFSSRAQLAAVGAPGPGGQPVPPSRAAATAAVGSESSAAGGGRQPAGGAEGAISASGNSFDEVNYQARRIQQLTASEEDDLTVYRSSDMDGAAQAAQGVLRNPAAASMAAAAAAQAAPGSSGADQAAGAGGSTARPMERFEIDVEQQGSSSRGTTGAMAAAAAASAAQGQADDVWEKTFRGLVYADGVDALGRPVIVINADAVPPNMKSSALVYCRMHLEPIGHYVLVFTAKKAVLPSMWIMGAYRTLPRPFRKNVQYIILVRPSGFLRAILAFMRPFVSNKAGRKIRAVDSVQEIGDATGGEVTVQHLGAQFNANLDALA
ncbi:hypothetical protein N2152v2_006687 [Parachlorella kessleri]